MILKGVDKKFLLSVALLSIGGFIIFVSASLGLLARNENLFKSIALNQFLFGLCLGSITMIVTSYIPLNFWKKWSLILFFLSAVLTALVFIPGIGWRHGGALRWISLGGINFQPSELLKIGYILYLGALLSKYKEKITNFKSSIVPFMLLTAGAGSLLILQPDNDTFFIMCLAGFSMLFVAGAKIKHLLAICLLGLVCFGTIIAFRPYVLQRIMTFLNPSDNSLTSGYQIQQSMIAIGSGGLFGKGFGQSSQKFNFLPEPIGDSVFAVASEEFGLLGSVLIICAFLFFGFRGLKIAQKTNDQFGRLVVVGIVILVLSESFMNIGAMLGIIPLSGTPLLFISHGGTALFITLATMGIILNISKKQKK